MDNMDINISYRGLTYKFAISTKPTCQYVSGTIPHVISSNFDDLVDGMLPIICGGLADE